MDKYMNNFILKFKNLSEKHQPIEIFMDFLELTTIAISNATEMCKHILTRREERYKAIVKKYSKSEMLNFEEMLCSTIDILARKNYMGEVFMELGLGDKWKGQFFTPLEVSKVIAEINFYNGNFNFESGFITVMEPECGGGTQILALCEILKENGHNPQLEMKVIAKDIDLIAVHMTYMQLSLLGIPAKVYHTNVLSDEIFDAFKTPAWVLDGWDYRKNKFGNLTEMVKNEVI